MKTKKLSFRPSVLSLPQNCLVKPRNKKKSGLRNKRLQSIPPRKKSITCILRWYVRRPRHRHECCATRLLTREPSRPTTSQFSHKCCIRPFLVMSSILCKATVTWQWKVSYWLMLECLAAYLYTCYWNSWFFFVCWKTAVADAYFRFYGFGFCKIYFACPLDKRG